MQIPWQASKQNCKYKIEKNSYQGKKLQAIINQNGFDWRRLAMDLDILMEGGGKGIN